MKKGEKMYCSKCGKQISEDATFCSFCGAKNDNLVLESNTDMSTVNQQTSINNVFNRDVLINYLYNIRVLEVYVNNLNKKRMNYEYWIPQYGMRKVQDRLPETIIDGFDDGRGWGFANIAIFLGIGELILSILKVTIGKLFDCEGFFAGFRIVYAAILILIAIIYLIYIAVEVHSGNKDYEIRLNEDIERVGNELKQKEQLTEELNQLKIEIDKAENLLSEAYSANIIPSKFRNIYASYFLYDYISTSSATLSEALLHCDLDTIQQKLDTIINQQEEIIMELAYQNALNEQIVQQNENILQHAIQTENNTALAAQYTKAAAVNSSVTAYVQLTEYFKK